MNQVGEAAMPVARPARRASTCVLLGGYAVGYALLVYAIRVDNIRVFGGVVLGSLGAALLLRRIDYVRETLVPLAERAMWLNRACLAVALLAFPAFFLDNSYWVHVAVMCGLYIIMAQGLNVHVGDGGMVNLGYAVFFAVGAYTVALLTVRGWSFWLTLPLAVVSTMIVGALIGLCLVRSRGDYLALVTIGFGLIMLNFAVNLREITRGPDGISGIPPVTLWEFSLNEPSQLAGIEIPFEVHYYYVVLAFAALTWLALRRIRSSYLGRSWIAIGQDEIAAATLGIDVPRSKFKLFIIGSACGGLAGGLFVGLNRFVAPSDFTFIVSVTLISMVVVGGAGNMWGVAAGAALLYFLPEKLRGIESLRLMVYGVVLIALMVYRPSGLFPRRGTSVFRR